MSPSLTSERDREVLRSFARRIDPSDAGAHNNLGVLYYNKGLYEEAVSAFMRALELDAKMQVAQHVHEARRHRLFRRRDLRRDLLESRHVDRRDADHDGPADHLRQRRGCVARADVRHFSESVQLQRLQRTNVIHGSAVKGDCSRQ